MGSEQTEPSNIRRLFREYWAAYGGFRAAIKSWFFVASLLILATTFPIWQVEGWWSYPLDTLPDLLGFSLGAFAFLIGFGSERFLNLIAGQTPGSIEPSPYKESLASFLHFILVQMVAFLFAVVMSAFWKVPSPAWFATANELLRPIAWAFGFWLFTYALCLLVAAALAAFQVALWFDDVRTQERERQANSKPHHRRRPE